MVKNMLSEESEHSSGGIISSLHISSSTMRQHTTDSITIFTKMFVC